METATDAGPEALDLLTVKETADRLRVSTSTIRRLIGSGDLEAVRIGSLVRIAPEALAEYKAHLRRAAHGTEGGGPASSEVSARARDER